MTKRELILKAALELFAEHGFYGTTTAKISKNAGVSEGLIYKHFKSKKNLLEAIFSDVEEKVKDVFVEMLNATEPQEVISSFVDAIYSIKEEDYPYWRLSFKLKWERQYYNKEAKKVFVGKLKKALKQMEYENASIEAELLYNTIEAIGMAILREGKKSQLRMKRHLKSKYIKKTKDE